MSLLGPLVNPCSFLDIKTIQHGTSTSKLLIFYIPTFVKNRNVKSVNVKLSLKKVKMLNELNVDSYFKTSLNKLSKIVTHAKSVS